jgi:type III secretion protein D
MKVLRILTGTHAGARLALTEGNWHVQRLDPANESWQPDEINLMDWHGEPLSLRVGPTGCVCLDAQEAAYPWPDFDVRRFGDVVLCVGEDSAIWPSDATLMANLPSPTLRMTPVATGLLSSARRMAAQLVVRNVLVVSVAAIFLLPMVLLVLGPKNIQAAPNAQNDARAATFMAKVKQALHAENIPGLHVRVAQGRVWVEGLVNDAAEDAIARKTLQPFDRLWVVSAWQTATQVSDTMTTALHDHGVQVRHAGGGHFVVEGSTERPEELRSKAAKLKNDFSSNVLSLEVRAQTKASAQPKVSAMLETADLHYVVRPDGSKSFVAQTHP